VARLSKEKAKLARQVGVLTAIPFVLLTGPAIGYLLGSWLDGRFKTEPTLLIICLLLGFVASGREVYRLIRLASREDEK
jgi:F0F1-type ATP synthase assembly protein I